MKNFWKIKLFARFMNLLMCFIEIFEDIIYILSFSLIYLNLSFKFMAFSSKLSMKLWKRN